VELTSNKAIVIDDDGDHHKLSKPLDRLVVDQCKGLKVNSGSVRVFYADDSGYPQEELVGEGSSLTGVGEEQYAPFAFLVSQVRNLVNGDVSSAAGSKRAFSQTGINGFPSQKVLYPKKDWYFTGIGAQSKSFQLMNKSGAVIAVFQANKDGVFKLSSKYLKPGNVYKWQAGNKHDSFMVLSQRETKEIKREIADALPKGASDQLRRMTYAAICNDYNLFFDSLRVISNAK